MSYPTYLVHFNKNHSPKDGKFTYGDGDGDGIADDHSKQKSDTYGEYKSQQKASYKEYKQKKKENYRSAKHKSKRDWTAEEQYAMGSHQLKKGIAQFVGSYGMLAVARVTNDMGYQGTAAAFLAGFAALHVAGIVTGVKGGKNMYEGKERKEY